MPLKDVDIKTFEAYKKAMRQEVTRLTETGKIKFWVYKDVELPDQSGRKQKILAFVALVDDAGIRSFLRTKKLVCTGICHLDHGKVAFEPIKGKVPYNQLKISVPLMLGKPLYIPTTATPEDEADDAIEDDDEPVARQQSAAQTPPAAPPGPGAAAAPAVAPIPVAPPPAADPALAASWAQLQARMEASFAAVPSRREPVSRLAAGIADFVKAGNVKAATEKMDAVRAALAAPPPVPPPAPPDPALVSAWDLLQKKTQAAEAANPARKDALARAAAGIPELIKANNAVEARKRMSALEALLTQPPAASPHDPAVLKAEWGKLVPRIKATGSAALNQAAAEAGKHLNDLVNQGKLAEAQSVIDQLTAQVDHFQPAETAHRAETPKLTPTDIADAWHKLVPEMEQKSKVHPELRDAAMRVRKQAEELTKAGKLEAAKAALDDLVALLAKTSAEAAKPTQAESAAAENPQRAEFEHRRAQLEPDIRRALQEQIGDVSRIRAAVALAGERAEGGDYASALKILAGLDTLLRETETDEAEMPVPGLVEYRKKLFAFDLARRKAEKQIDTLAAVIPAKEPEQSDLADALHEEFEDEMDEIQNLIDAAINAANDEKTPADAALKTRVENSIKALESSRLLQHIEKNPFGVTIDIRTKLVGALKDVLESMPVAV